jgi:hypothetical protein
LSDPSSYSFLSLEIKFKVFFSIVIIFFKKIINDNDNNKNNTNDYNFVLMPQPDLSFWGLVLLIKIIIILNLSDLSSYSF